MGKIIRFKKRTGEVAVKQATATAKRDVAAFAADAAGQYIFVNAHWSKLTGISQTGALRDGWLHAVHPDDRKEVLKTWQAAVRGERYFGMTYRIHSIKSGTRWVLSQAMPQHDDDGELTGYGGMIADTALFAQAARPDSAEDRLRAALDMTGLAFFEYNLKSDEIWGTAAFKNLCGRVESLTDFMAVLHPDDAPHIRETINKALASRGPIANEYRIGTRGKGWRHIKCHSKILYDSSNRPSYIIGILAPAEAFVEDPRQPGVQLLHRLSL